MQIINFYPKNRKASEYAYALRLVYIKGIQKVSYCFFYWKNTPKLINQQFKNLVKIVNWQKKVSYYFFTVKNISYLKLKNEVKIVNWQQ